MTAIDVAPAIALVEQDVRELLARRDLPLDDDLVSGTVGTGAGGGRQTGEHEPRPKQEERASGGNAHAPSLARGDGVLQSALP